MQYVLVVAEKKKFGAGLVRLLQGPGCVVTIAESCPRKSVLLGERAEEKILDLVILTNTCLTPPHILKCVLRVKAQLPCARMLVLSGYSPKLFVADLRKKGIDAFLSLPYEEESLLMEIAWLLSMPRSPV